MRTYQVISVDHAGIEKDINNNIIKKDELHRKSQKFLDTLLKTDFEVFESSKVMYGLPSQLLVGGENALPIKMKVYEIAELAGLSKYIGNGEFYMQMKDK